MRPARPFGKPLRDPYVSQVPRLMATRIGHGTVRTTMEVYTRASDYAEREAADLLQAHFAAAFGGQQTRPHRGGRDRPAESY